MRPPTRASPTRAGAASVVGDAAPLPRPSRPRLVRRARRALRQTRDTVLGVLLLAVVALLRAVPLRTALRVTAATAAAVAPWLGTTWRRARRHLALAFPDVAPAERDAIARAAFANLGRSLAELAHFPSLRRDLAAYVTIEGREHMDVALAGGRGMLAITGHIGNWELLAAYCAAIGYPVDVIGRRANNPLLNRILVAFRARAGVTTILRETPQSGRAILRTLRANRILALLIDQDTRGPRVFVPFFGRLAATPSGVAVLALRTGAPVVALFIGRRSEGGHAIRVYPFPPTDPARDDVEGLTAAYTAAIEAHIRTSPEEWVWWHRRWRRRPAIGMTSPIS